MLTPSERPADGIEAVVNNYANMLFRICLVTLGNEADAEDAMQDVFIKYMQKAPVFENSVHEKAWLIRVSVNKCRDMLRSKRAYIDLESIQEYAQDTESVHMLEALMALPDKFRTVLTLYYVEEYKVKEIAEMIGKTESAVKMRLKKGRMLLEEEYKKEI